MRPFSWPRRQPAVVVEPNHVHVSAPRQLAGAVTAARRLAELLASPEFAAGCQAVTLLLFALLLLLLTLGR